MVAKHRMTTSDQRIHRRSEGAVSRWTTVVGASAVSMLCGAGITAMMVGGGGSEPTSAPAPAGQAPQPVIQDGTLIAVSPDSVTARSADGFTRTYRITPDTTAISGGAQNNAPASHFAVNDEVEIVGTIDQGTAVATAVADGEVAHLNGPPMDYVDITHDGGSQEAT
jgi:hypothetical protein